MSSGLQLNQISVSENEFLAEEELIWISPRVKHPQLLLLSGNFGPFEPYVPVQVPLWLAITLKKKEKCTIVIPQWMSVESLEAAVKEERTSPDLCNLPFHYVEIAAALLKNCQDEILQPDKVSALLQDLENIRADRLRMGILSIASSAYTYTAQLNNISSLEILSIKGLLVESMGMFDNIASARKETNENSGGDMYHRTGGFNSRPPLRQSRN